MDTVGNYLTTLIFWVSEKAVEDHTVWSMTDITNTRQTGCWLDYKYVYKKSVNK